MTSTDRVSPSRRRVRAQVVLCLCVGVLGAGVAIAFAAMRSVMGVGGSCGSSGAYVATTECPDGSWLIAPAIPVLIITSFIGSAVAHSLRAPNLLLPMWALLFTALGWNFLEYGLLEDGLVFGWLFCAVLFAAMAAPAWWFIGKAAVATARDDRAGLTWWAAYALLGGAGAFVGIALHTAAAA